MKGTAFLKARQTRYGAYVTVYTLIVLAVLVIVNLLARDRNKSFDATANKRFSLSDQTAKVVGGLAQDVRILFFSRPDGVQAARDLLDRYDVLSPRLSVAYVDVDKKRPLAAAYGVQRLGQVIVESGQKREEANGLTEEEVTGAIIRAVKTGQRTVCAVAGSGELDWAETQAPNGAGFLKQAVEKSNYKTRTLALVQKAEIPPDCSVVLVLGPRQDYPEPIVTALKRHIESGGRALFLLGPPLRLREAIAENQALTAALAGYGVTLDKNAVLESSMMSQLIGFGPWAPLVRDFQGHPIVRPMRGASVLLPFARSLTVGAGGKTTVERLFASSNESATTTNLASPEIDTASLKEGSSLLAAAATYDTGNKAAPGRFVVVGSSAWVQNDVLDIRGVANRDLFLNMLNWLSSDEDLISIRPKEDESRSLSLRQGDLVMIRSVSQFLLPLAFLALGTTVWWRRR